MNKVSYNFNSAAKQQAFELIPAKTRVKAVVDIKPGGFVDPDLGVVCGNATQSPNTGSIYLNMVYTIAAGPLSRRKVFGLVGIHSNKGKEWGQSGRSLIKAILNSHFNLHPDDNSERACSLRDITDFNDLKGLEPVIQIDIETRKDTGEQKNVVRYIVEPDHPDYAALKGVAPITSTTGNAPTRPEWA